MLFGSLDRIGNEEGCNLFVNSKYKHFLDFCVFRKSFLYRTKRRVRCFVVVETDSLHDLTRGLVPRSGSSLLYVPEALVYTFRKSSTRAA